MYSVDVKSKFCSWFNTATTQISEMTQISVGWINYVYLQILGNVAKEEQKNRVLMRRTVIH